MEIRTAPPSPGWIVQLTGHESDFSCWERCLRPPFDPWCERIPQDGSFVWALRSCSFDHSQSAAEVRERALPLIKWLNGALSAEMSAEPLKFCGVGCIDNQGRLNSHFFAELHDRARATDTFSAEARDANGNLIPPPSPAEASRTQKWIKAATGSGDIARALKHFGQPPNWYDMWTVYEIIEEELWHSTPQPEQPKRKGKLKPQRVLLLSRKWVSEDDLCQFAESCNYYRHGAKKPSVQPSTKDNARQILTRILQSWLKEKIP
jgi:hypothetical protein